MAVEKAAKTFQDIEQEYDHLFEVEPVRDEDRAYRWFAERLLAESPQGSRFLDLACGGGYFYKELQAITPRKLELTGLDISSKALELARENKIEAEWVKGIAEEVPVEDSRFDGLTCLGSMEHFMDIPKAIAEMRRVVRSEGVFLILVPNMFWYKDMLSVLFTADRKQRNQTHEKFASQGEWEELLKSCGLEIRKTVKYNGIAKSPFKQSLKDLLIPVRFSYHFLFICTHKKG